MQFSASWAGCKDKDAILGSLDPISDLAEQTADLSTGIRPSFVKDVKGLRQVAEQPRPAAATRSTARCRSCRSSSSKIGRTAIYGSFFNFYLCEFKGSVVLPGGNVPTVPVRQYDTTGGTTRCNLG